MDAARATAYNAPPLKAETALLSVYDRRGLVPFARGLGELGIRILSTGGTARELHEGGIPLQEVAQVTGAPEILGGRVKTLHPRIHGGILAVRDDPEHRREASEQDIGFIDLVVVNLYPFSSVAEDSSRSPSEVIENIDIGGPAMVRAAAKNHRYVTVVIDPGDYDRVLRALREGKGDTGEALRREMAAKAFRHTADYDDRIARYFSGAGGPGSVALPESLYARYRKSLSLRYGENPHQEGALYVEEGRASREAACVAKAVATGGKALSYNNLLDLESAFELVREFAGPACAIVKHNNPCGAALADSAKEAFLRARDGDPVSAYGGIVALNVALDPEAAGAMAGKGNFFEAVIAPAIEERARDVLRSSAKWGASLRMLAADGAMEVRERELLLRGIRGGLLVQTEDAGIAQEWKAGVGALTDRLREELAFAMTVCKHVRSNAVVITSDRKVVGVGAGQQSRLDAAEIAVRKAGARASGAVAASDAFFPFPDALEALGRAGVKAVAHPGGSIRDEQVEQAARRHGVVLVTTGMRHFRH